MIPPRPQITDGGDVMAVVPRSRRPAWRKQPPPPPPPRPPQAAPAPEAEMDA